RSAANQGAVTPASTMTNRFQCGSAAGPRCVTATLEKPTWRPGRLSSRVTDSLLDAFVGVEKVLRTGRALELRRPLFPLAVEADFQRVPVDLVDTQHDRPLARALGHGHIDGLR